MKKISLFFVTIFVTVLVSGQIQMNSTGNVGIGGSTPSTTYKLATPSISAQQIAVSNSVTLNRNLIITNDSYIGLKTDLGGTYDLAFFPTSNNYGKIG